MELKIILNNGDALQKSNSITFQKRTSASAILPPDAGPKIKQLFNQAAYESAKFSVENGVLPEDHPLTCYIRELFSRLQTTETAQECQVFVCDKNEMKGINALAFANGHIYTSKDMISFCEFEEEVLYVLSHELQHIEKQHLNDALAQDSGAYLARFGSSRFYEYQADISGFLALNDRKINSHGGVIFCQKLKVKESGTDLTHGTTLDRLINLLWSTRFKDLEHISCDGSDLTPIPQAIHDISNSKLTTTRKTRDFSQIYRTGKLIKAIDDYHTELYIYTENKHDKIEHLRKCERLEQYIKKELKDHLQLLQKHPGLADATFFIIMDLSYKDPYLDKSTYSCAREYKRTFEAAGEPLLLLELLRKDALSSLGLFYQKGPETITETIVALLIKQGIFDDAEGDLRLNDYLQFCQDLAESLSDIYAQHAYEPLNESRFFTFLAVIALNASGLGIKSFVNKLKKSAWPLFNERTALTLLKGALEDEDLSERPQTPRRYIPNATDLSQKEHVLKMFISFEQRFRDSEWELQEQLTFLKNNERTLLPVIMRLDDQEIIVVNRYFSNIRNGKDFQSNYTKRFSKRTWGIRNDNKDDFIYESLEDNIPFTHLLSCRHIKATLHNIHIAAYLLQYLSSDLEEFLNDFLYDRPMDILKLIPDFRSLREVVKTLTEDEHKKALNGILLFAFYHVTVSDIRKGGLSKEECFERLSWLAQELEIVHVEEVSSTMRKHIYDHRPSEAEAKAGLLKTANHLFLNTVLTTYPFELQNTADKLYLLQLVDLLYERNIAGMVIHQIMTLISQEDSFDDIQGLLFEKNRYNTDLLAKFVEEVSRTPAQLDTARTELVNLETKTQFLKKVSGGMMIEEVIAQCFKEEKLTWLITLLNTHTDDSDIKKTLYSLLHKFQRFPAVLPGFSLVIYDRLEERPRCIRESYLAQLPDALPLRHMTAEEYLSGLYNLSYPEKTALTRLLLIGNNGVLLDPMGRAALLRYFLTEFIASGTTTEEKELYDVITEVLEALFLHASTEVLYLLISPLITKWMLVPPEKERQTSWETIISEHIQSRRGYLRKNYTEDRIKQMQSEALAVCQRTPSSSYSAEDLAYNDIILKMIGSDPRQRHTADPDKISPVSLVVDIARDLGSLGVRFLQVLGQYVHIPESYREEFDNVYDGVQGQSKLTAYETLLREWPTLPEEVKEISPSIGGGSMMTVYTGEFQDGHTEVIKVANPNLVYVTDQLASEIKRILAILAKEKGSGYAIANILIDDITEWIKQDFSYEQFLQQNNQFHADQNGYRQKPEDRYQIKVPQAFGTENKFHKREEYIRGIGLTKKHEQDLLAKGHDLKQIVRAIGHSYIKQILDGRVHSDVHIGNFLVTDNDECAILDRNFYVELDNADKGFIFNIALAHTDTAKTVDTVMNYFMPDTDGTRSEEKETLKKELQELLLQKAGADIPEKLSAMMVFLHEKNIPIPLKITLLVKNLNGLDKMAKAAGYNGLIDILL